MDFEKKLESYIEKYAEAPIEMMLVTRLMIRVADILQVQLNKASKPFSMHVHEYLALILIKFTDSPIRPTELSESLGISRPQITRLLDALEQKGFITREHSTTDRRALILLLTEEGQKQMDLAAPALHQAYHDSWGESQAHIQTILEGIRPLYANLREMAEAEGEEEPH